METTSQKETIKKYKNFLFISAKELNELKLPHNNCTLLGIVDECINAPYAEEFSKEIVSKDKNDLYLDYELGEYNYDSAVDSLQTLVGRLDLKPTDYILRNERK